MSNKAGKVEVLKGRSGFHEPLKKIDLEKYGKNYDQIFGKKKEKDKVKKDKD